ncbi:cobalt-precorrin 5A hydrolase [uncultured Treponema sp.]|uniref:cobalt-precorrin 5A hydrolase n=1 Tax=uncultured Treponema sp. TaxID=162155 RepID=UPI0025FFD66A|nr:cobalt-precorrin 5A hydrolase [uncultured Treponema sp.]
MRVHIISFTENGFSLAKKIQNLLYNSGDIDAESFFEDFSEITAACVASLAEPSLNLSEWVKTHFIKGNCLVFVGAAGIAVRSIAPFIKDKTSDAAVIVIDEKANFVIPILSGHIGGANRISRLIAEKLGAKSVITTASDVNNLPAIDEFAAKNNLIINDMKKAKDFAAKMCHLHSGHDSQSEGGDDSNPRFTVSVYIKNDILNLIPKSVILGVGCKNGKSPEEFEKFILEALASQKIDFRAVEKLASIDLKKDEDAILCFAKKYALSFESFSAEDLNKIPQEVSHSDFVSKITGTDNVCERSVFAAGADNLIMPKICRDGMTLAIGERKIEINLPQGLKECLL